MNDTKWRVYFPNGKRADEDGLVYGIFHRVFDLQTSYIHGWCYAVDGEWYVQLVDFCKPEQVRLIGPKRTSRGAQNEAAAEVNRIRKADP